MRPQVSPLHRGEEAGPTRSGLVVLAVVALLFLAVCLPVVLRGAPLADDFTNCLQPQRIGLGQALADSVRRLGVLRRAHFVEIILTTEVCQHLPFGVAIAVPLVLTLAVAFLLRGLLRDLGAPGPWPDLGAALWLLQPLGTEAALWPAAIHVSLGLALALAALRLHRSGHHWWATLAVVGAGLSVEQVFLALPLAVWLTAGPERRSRALGGTASVILLLLIAALIWPGNDPRLHVGLSDRIVGAVHDPGFLVLLPALGLGLQSIPLAILWAFPLSVAALAGGGVLGSRFAPAIFSQRADRNESGRVRRTLLGGIALIVLANVPVVFSVPHEGSPRLFAPSWLVISGAVPMIAFLLRFRRPRVWGAAAGVFAAGALLSLGLSVWVRVNSADFTRFASMKLAAEVPDGATIGLCGVRRTVVSPAPRGAFAVHEFIYDWAARDALYYYAHRRAEFVLAGELWKAPCPEGASVDRVVSFPALLKAWRSVE
jgi:hypothetical protein